MHEINIDCVKQAFNEILQAFPKLCCYIHHLFIIIYVEGHLLTVANKSKWLVGNWNWVLRDWWLID